MVSDIAEALNVGFMAALIILDLPAAFDIILLKHLEFSFCIKEKTLTWVKSSLADCVLLTDKISPDVPLHFGIAQVSILGPKNYYMYTKQLVKLFNSITLNIIVMPMILKST